MSGTLDDGDDEDDVVPIRLKLLVGIHSSFVLSMEDIELSEMLSHAVSELTIDDMLQQSMTKVKLRKLRMLCHEHKIDIQQHVDGYACFYEHLKTVNGRAGIFNEASMQHIRTCIQQPYELRIKNIGLQHIQTCITFMQIRHLQRSVIMFDTVRESCLRQSCLNVTKVLRQHRYDPYARFLEDIKDNSLIPLCSTAARLGIYALVDLLGFRLVLYATKMTPEEFTGKHVIAHQYQQSVDRYLKQVI